MGTDGDVNILLWKNKIWESRVSNAGDLAIIRNTFLKLKQAIPNVRLHIISDDPEYSAEHYGVVAHPVAILRSPTRLVQLLRQIDLVILGGGTVLQDDYFVGIIPINLSVPLLAKALGKKIVANAIGVGSDEEISALGVALCRLALRRFDSISVRDDESRAMIERWVPPSTPLKVTNDIAVDLPEAPFEAIESALREEGVDLREGETVAIAARKIYHHERTLLYVLPSSLRQRLGLQGRLHQQRLDEFKTTLARFCDHIVERYGVKILFTPFYSSGGGVDSRGQATPRRMFSSGDNAFAEEVAARIKNGDAVRILRRNYAPEELLAIIGRCSAMVGVPYHSVVFASSRCVPVLGIHYVSKVERYMRILGMDDYVATATVERGLPLDDLTSKFERLWQRRRQIQTQLRDRHERLVALAQDNIDYIKDVLGGSH